MFKFGLLVLGCFFVGAAVVPLVMWGVTGALVNFYPNEASKIAIPSMMNLILYSLIYSLELAVGLVCIKKALK
ncbi:MAG: hypothetical protein HYT64_00420 [Candidatus Yanofskybacteria bacterium]|nr:hypothetical protein [Candidatus Yanofskybacteria bacterium]